MISVVAIYCIVWLLCIYAAYSMCKQGLSVYAERAVATSRMTMCSPPAEPAGYEGRLSGAVAAVDTAKKVFSELKTTVGSITRLDTQALLRNANSSMSLMMSYMMLGIFGAFTLTIMLVLLMMHASKFLMAGVGVLAGIYSRDAHAKEMIFSIAAGEKTQGVGERMKKLGAGIVTEIVSLRGVGKTWYIPAAWLRFFGKRSCRYAVMDFVLEQNVKLGRLFLGYITTFLGFMVTSGVVAMYGSRDYVPSDLAVGVSFWALASCGMVIIVLANLLSPPMASGEAPAGS